MTKEQQEFIVTMLRHASYKKYENYVLSGIYWKLVSKGIELKLVTQQTVFREDDDRHVAYMDAYFPVLNIQIEVDEAHHKYQKKQDAKREDDIMKVLGAMQLKSEPIVIRIDATKDLNIQIDNAVKSIEDTYHKFGNPKWIDIDNAEVVREKRFISFNDNMIFKLKNDLVNSLGYSTAKGREFSKHGTQSISLLNYNDNVDIWFPRISDNVGKDGIGWLNDFDVKTKIFRTQLVGNFKRNCNWLKAEEKFKAGTYKDRYIIFKVADAFNNHGFKYYGKFHCIFSDGKNQIEEWKLISTEDLKCKA